MRSQLHRNQTLPGNISSRMFDFKVCFLLTFFLLLDPPAAFNQQTVGQISGTARDETGAVMPGVGITVTDSATALVRTTTTDAGGYYVFSSLPVGTYNVTAALSGFKGYLRTGVKLDVGAKLTIDATMTVGDIAETIEVRAGSVQVETSTGEVGRMITGEQVTQLALNGRNYFNLLQITPGVSASFRPFDLVANTGAISQVSVSGLRSTLNFITIDGVDNMDHGANVSHLNNLSIDALEEFKVLSSSFSAEFGRSAGAAINLVTRSGTRDFHGTFYEFFRNDVLDARSFFALRREPLRFNDFGYTIGGPIYWPNMWNTDKKRAFFFFGQEWKRIRTAAGFTRTGLVPTLEERKGDFRSSGLACPRDPLIRQPFPDCVIPSQRMSPNGSRLVNIYPLPNRSGPGNNFVASPIAENNTREEVARVDYNLSGSSRLYVRYVHDVFEIPDPFGLAGGNPFPLPAGWDRTGENFVANLTTVLSPRDVNEFSFGTSGNFQLRTLQGESFTRQTHGLNFPEIFPVNRLDRRPNVSITGFTAITGTGLPFQNFHHKFIWKDNYSKTMGAHNVKMGFQIVRYRSDHEPVELNDNGSFAFSTAATNTSGNALADALLGNFFSYGETERKVRIFARTSDYEFYLTDNWKVRPNLTLDLGLRYQLLLPNYSRLNAHSTFVPRFYDPRQVPELDRVTGTITPGTGDLFNGVVICGDGFTEAAIGREALASDPESGRFFRGLPRSCVDTRKNMFGPRFSFAWDPFTTGKTAIRGGAGVFYDRGGIIRVTGDNIPFRREVTVFNGSVENPGGGTSRLTPLSMIGVPEVFPVTTVYNWSFGIQRELPSQILADVSYVGNRAKHLQRIRNLNQVPVGARILNPGVAPDALRPFRGLGDINMSPETSASSWYDSLQVSVSRRLAEGLSFGVAYTLSKALNDADGDTSGPLDSYNLRLEKSASSFDRRQMLVFNYIWRLPFFRGQTGVAGHFLGGWEISGITSFQTGLYSTVVGVGGDPAGFFGGARADLIADPNLPRGGRTLALYFNRAAFACPGTNQGATGGRTPCPRTGAIGNSPRHPIEGPGMNNWDLSLFKNNKLSERVGLQFRFEAFNIFNHPSFAGISTNFDAGNFGQVTSALDARIIQFGLKFLY
ncbi:MAG: Plug and carboxypeptidase regulatory-like domain-containing protein [Acidobacteria bacterium]|nr:Plug and carboxypeptidase regulatory-like domain-containing protein [Acidobacteriota bacterium]